MAAKPVAIVMGSQSDWATLRHTAETLDALEVGYEVVALPTVSVVQSLAVLLLHMRRTSSFAMVPLSDFKVKTAAERA